MTPLMMLAIGIWAQDTTPVPKDEPAKPEARAALTKAFEATAALGGFEFKGDVSDPSQEAGAGVSFHFGGESFLGDYTGRVGKDGTIRLDAKNDKLSAAVFRRNGKTVKRQTWTGPQPTVDAFAEEATSILNFAHLARAAAELKDKDCRAGADLKVDGVECRAVKATFPARLIQREAVGDEATFEMMELQQIEATFYLSKADSRIAKVKVNLEFGLSESVKVEMGDQGADVDMKKQREYEFKVVKYDPELKVEIPDDVGALLGD